MLYHTVAGEDVAVGGGVAVGVEVCSIDEESDWLAVGGEPLQLEEGVGGDAPVSGEGEEVFEEPLRGVVESESAVAVYDTEGVGGGGSVGCRCLDDKFGEIEVGVSGHILLDERSDVGDGGRAVISVVPLVEQHHSARGEAEVDEVLVGEDADVGEVGGEHHRGGVEAYPYHRGKVKEGGGEAKRQSAAASGGSNRCVAGVKVCLSNLSCQSCRVAGCKADLRSRFALL